MLRPRLTRLPAVLLASLLLGPVVGEAHAAPLRIEDVSAIQPVRVLDTRTGTGVATIGAPIGRLVAGVDLPVTMPAPAGATSVMVNITAVDALADGWIKAWPCDEASPETSSLNYTPGIVSANAAIVRMASSRICLATSQPVNVVVDVTGWFFGTSNFSASSPHRLLDTRISGDPLISGQERRLTVAGTPGIDPGATIAGLNITVDRPAIAGYVVAYPCGQPTDASTVNFVAGEIVANFTIVGLSGGDVCFRSYGNLNLIVDTFGWSTGGGRLKVQSPTRLLDTRDNVNWGQGPAPSSGTISLRVAGRAGVPNTADAALLTVTVADPPGEGFVTVWPCDEGFPLASTVNTFPGALRSNLTLVKLSVINGEACLRYEASKHTPTNLIVDAAGWITGTASRPSASPCSIAGAAFCETFDAPAGGGTRTGDLSPVLWGVSRLGQTNPGGMLNDIAQVSMQGCGTTAWTMTPGDVRICDGQLYETVNDGGNVVNLDTYPKQPFSFGGRTGKVTFDVSADSDGSHGAWPEFVITDKPVPGVRGSISGQTPPGAANSVGFALDGGCGQNGMTGVGLVFVTRNYQYAEPSFSTPSCITKGSGRSMNHFEVRVSQNRLEVWGTDAGGTVLKQLAVADNLALSPSFTQGLVWLNDVHYNARKAVEPCGCGTQWNHTFVWDNLGFDGPKTYRDLGFDVPDANVPGQPTPDGDATRRVGFKVGTGPVTLEVPGVRRDQTPTGALVVLNTYSFAPTVPSVSVNGNAYVDTPWPAGWQTYGWGSIAIPVPLEQVHDGTNTLTFRSGDASTLISNISIILVAASPVP